jgi:hypothetical protein
MPWLLLAMLGGAGALYYEKNKGLPARDTYRVTFPASSPALRDAINAFVGLTGGIVTDDLGNGVYIVSMPHNLEVGPIPGFGNATSVTKVSGTRIAGQLGSVLSPDDRFQGVDPDEARFPSGQTIPEGFQIAGMRWNGRTLR